MSSFNNKLIAKNTLFLYLRLIIGMVVSFYTTRIVLNALGVVDYGIKNVVGGLAVMFQFLNGTLAVSTQRFLSFDMGRGDKTMMNISFNLAMYIHIGLAVSVIVITEIFGIWLLQHKMVIPIDRMQAAYWVFHLSMITALFSMTQVPYSACINAHEKMNVYAYLGLLSILLNLLIAMAIKYSPFDYLIFYSLMTTLVTIFIMMLNRRYCVRHFKEAKLRRVWDKKRLKEMISFAGWNFSAHFSLMARTSGVNILINMFFGPTTNAARGIAVSVFSALFRFSSSFVNAITPQITKSYASGDVSRMHRLLCYGCKYTFFLFFVLALPVILEINYILSLWLINPPTMAVDFCRLVLISALIDMVSYTMMYGIFATGDVKRYQIVMSCAFLMVPLGTYILYKQGFTPAVYLYVEILVYFLAIFLRPYLLSMKTGLRFMEYVNSVLLKDIAVVIVSLPIPVAWVELSESSFTRLLLTIVLSMTCVIISICLLGLENVERIKLRFFVAEKIKYARNFSLWRR